MTSITAIREQWLETAIELMKPHFTESIPGVEFPKVRVSVGWPGGRSGPRTIGQCWAPFTATDNVSQIFISPVLDDPILVLATIAHELIHAIDENKSGHKGAFGVTARAIGLEGRLTATVAGEALTAVLATILAKLGTYPHAALMTASMLSKPGTPESKPETPRSPTGAPLRAKSMQKVVCAAEEKSGYLVRISNKWLDLHGTPKCPCHGLAMEVEY